MDRLTSITAFVRTVESGSFTAAAKMLGISPQMIAKHVRALESRFGSRLLNRTTRRQSLTEFGEDFFVHCRRILDGFDAMESMADETIGIPRGKLRVNAPVSFGSTLLVPMVTDYLRHYPEVEVDLVLEDRLVDMVKEGFEVTFRIGALSDSDLIARTLQPFELTICASPDYLAERGTPTAPEDLLEHECLGYAFSLHAAETRWRLLRGGQVHEVAIRNRLRISNAAGLVSAALNGFAIVLVTRSLVHEHYESGKLTEVLPHYRVESRPMHLLYVADRRPTPKVRTFIEEVMKTFGSPKTRKSPKGGRSGTPTL
jgi:DNA-binding transcriptional LysR family regulator